jgi:chromosome segregation ATPase
MAGIETLVNAAKGHAREAKEAAQRVDARVEALAKEMAELKVMIFTDMMTLMGSCSRIEQALDAIRSDVGVLKGEMVATKLRVGRLDNENEANRESLRESRDSVRALADDVRTTQRRQADIVTANRIDRIKMDERYAAMKAEVAGVRSDVSASGQHAAVGEAFARKALDSVSELGEITKIKVEETIDIKREKREDKRHLWKWALGLVGAIAIASSGYALKACGVKDAPALTAPAAAH